MSNFVSRRGFLKLITMLLGTGIGSPLLASCSPKTEDEREIDIVIEENDIHYSPATLTIPRGTTVTWLNKSYYSQSATCDPKKAAQTPELLICLKAPSHGIRGCCIQVSASRKRLIHLERIFTSASRGCHQTRLERLLFNNAM